MWLWSIHSDFQWYNNDNSRPRLARVIIENKVAQVLFGRGIKFFYWIINIASEAAFCSQSSSIISSLGWAGLHQNIVIVLVIIIISRHMISAQLHNTVHMCRQTTQSCTLMYTVSKKTPTISFVHNFAKCWPIFKNFSSFYLPWNVQ